MFCKWCGKSIQLTDRKCPACGRETPPMSDCGGFYDLKHSNTGPATEKEIIKEVPNCAAAEKMEVKYAKERKTAKKHHTMTMLCFGILLIAIICTAVLAVSANIRLGKLKEQIGSIRIEMPVNALEDTTNESTEDQLGDESAERIPHNLELAVTVTNAEHPTICTAYNFGDYAKSAKVTTVTREAEKRQAVDVSFILSEDASIEVGMLFLQEETAMLSIGVKGRWELPLFDHEDFTYEWQYRTEGEDWLAVDQKLVAEDDGYCGLLRDAVGEEDGSRDFRCVITAEDEEGNTMTIMVDGFALPWNIPSD